MGFRPGGTGDIHYQAAESPADLGGRQAHAARMVGHGVGQVLERRSPIGERKVGLGGGFFEAVVGVEKDGVDGHGYSSSASAGFSRISTFNSFFNFSSAVWKAATVFSSGMST